MSEPTQLDPCIPVVTPFGHALAYFIWGDDRLVWYGCFQHETGENWWWLNNHVRLVPSMSDEQHQMSPITISRQMYEKLKPHFARYSYTPYAIAGEPPNS